MEDKAAFQKLSSKTENNRGKLSYHENGKSLAGAISFKLVDEKAALNTVHLTFTKNGEAIIIEPNG